MTNLEIIQAKSAFDGISEVLIQSLLTGRSLSWAASYKAEDSDAIELTTADLYMEIIATPDFKEGNLAINYDRETLKGLAAAIYRKHDDSRLSEIYPDPIESIELW